MKKLIVAAAVACSALAVTSAAAVAAGALGEFGNNCAYGLTQGTKKYTDCSIHEKVGDKLYCFGTQAGKEAFMEDPEGNVKKAESFYNDN